MGKRKLTEKERIEDRIEVLEWEILLPIFL